MKKLLILLAINLSLSLTGQTRFDFSSGLTVSSFTTDLVSDYGFDLFREEYINQGGSATSGVKNSVRLGFYIAAEADLFLSEKSFIKSGVRFTTTGDSFFFKTDDVVLQSSSGSESDEKFKLRPRLDYIAIPINYGVKLSDRISIYGGLTPSFVLNNILRTNRFEIDGDDVKQKWDKSDNTIEARDFTPFANGGISYYFTDGANLTFILDLRGNYSLTSVYDDPRLDDTTTDLNDSKLWNIELGIGVAIN